MSRSSSAGAALVPPLSLSLCGDAFAQPGAGPGSVFRPVDATANAVLAWFARYDPGAVKP